MNREYIELIKEIYEDDQQMGLIKSCTEVAIEVRGCIERDMAATIDFEWVLENVVKHYNRDRIAVEEV